MIPNVRISDMVPEEEQETTEVQLEVQYLQLTTGTYIWLPNFVWNCKVLGCRDCTFLLTFSHLLESIDMIKRCRLSLNDTIRIYSFIQILCTNKWLLLPPRFARNKCLVCPSKLFGSPVSEKKVILACVKFKLVPLLIWQTPLRYNFSIYFWRFWPPSLKTSRD